MADDRKTLESCDWNVRLFVEVAAIHPADLPLNQLAHPGHIGAVVPVNDKEFAAAGVSLGEPAAMALRVAKAVIDFPLFHLRSPNRSAIVRVSQLKFREVCRLHLCVSIHWLPRISKLRDMIKSDRH
jgi:hypothetical protein